MTVAVNFMSVSNQKIWRVCVQGVTQPLLVYLFVTCWLDPLLLATWALSAPIKAAACITTCRQ
jgi:hypothetical protein